MARKEKEITIEEGRDAGKTFKITEMPAVQADRWISRALSLLGKSNSEISALILTNGQEFLKEFAKIDYEETQPLLEELLSCASFIKDGVSIPMKGNMVDSVVEDWTTLFRLKYEAFLLSVGFLEQGGESTSE